MSIQRSLDDGTPAKHALVICDMQASALNAIPESSRRSLMDFISFLLEAASVAKYKVVFSGLAFSADYSEIPRHHKLYGALKRLYESSSSKSNRKKSSAVSWFVRDHSNTDFVFESKKHSVIWRSSHMPPITELAHQLQLEGYTSVAVVGIKTSQAVQSTAQALCDLGMRVKVLQECVLDDNPARHEAMMKHLLPLYCDVVPMATWLDEVMEMERLQKVLSSKPMLDASIRYFCNVERGGHMWLYCQELLKRGWSKYPIQHWYTDEITARSYWCPLAKQKVQFCDEPGFSNVSMFLKGRNWLDEKDKIWQICPEHMPPTSLINKQQTLSAGVKPEDYDSEHIFFVKETNKNGGKAVEACGNFSDALSKCQKGTQYVIQKHIENPKLTKDLRKCHVKSYFLLSESNGTWKLYMYPDSFLCVAAVPWSKDDLSADCQVTVKRSVRLRRGERCNEWSGWPLAYEASREMVSSLVQAAVEKGKLQRRSDHTRQFELFCADVMIDTANKAWLIECNFGCVLFDPTVDQELTTAGLKRYKALYEMEGDQATVNDHVMIADTVALVFDQNKKTKWERVAAVNA